VLVVEDDEDIREVFVQVLEEAGYSVEAASNGKEALALLRSGSRPGVVFLDLMMPIMNGYEFCDEKRRDASIAAVPVIVISADGRAEPKLKDTGVQGYLRKPLTLETILDAAARWFV
jgi:CheY-like chemotaxis protein